MNCRINCAVMLLFATTSLSSWAQKGEKNKFSFQGEPILRVFANYHLYLGSGDVNSAFEVERAYIGYKAQIHPDFTIKINLDIGSPDDVSEYSRIRRYAYFKNAALTYHKKWFSSSFGLIDMTHFALQEEFWDHRYIEKSFSDRFRFGPSADLGWNVVIQPVEVISVDLCVSNGEGYNNLQRDNTLKLGMGTILRPLEGLSIRLYGDIMEKTVIQATLASFVGYQFRDLFKIGAEYNYRLNDSYRENYNRYGYSLYASFFLPMNFELFGRYDWIVSNIPEEDDSPWSLAEDGSSVIAGVQYEIIKKIRIALCYRDWFPYAANMAKDTYLYVNFEYKY